MTDDPSANYCCPTPSSTVQLGLTFPSSKYESSHDPIILGSGEVP